MNETALHVWHPSLRAFGLRSLAIFGVTYIVVFPVWPVIGGVSALALTIGLCLLYMFVLDDFSQWIEHRKAVWTLTENTLEYENTNDGFATYVLTLDKITDVHKRFWWNVQLRLTDGTAVTMHYIDHPKDVRDIILNALNQGKPT